MITSWVRGPIAGSNPWRAMTIEWQVTLAAAGVQLRRDPAGRRRAVRVRRSRARSTPCCGAVRCRRQAYERVEPTIDPTVVLVVANETLVGDELLDAVRAPRRAGADPRRRRRARSTSRSPATSSTGTRAGRPPGRRVDRLVAELRAGGDPRARRRLRGRADHRGRGHPRARADRRADRLDAPGGDLGLAPEAERPRRAPQARGRPPVRARRLRRRGADGSGERARDRERDRARRPPARPDPRAGRREPGGVPRSSARRATRTRASIPRPSAGSAPRSRRSARRASRPTGRSRTPTRTPPRCRWSRTSASTR